MSFEYPLKKEMTKIEKLNFVKEQLGNSHFILLPNTIAINNVYKINYCGDLNIDGFELGFLYLPVDSGILKHTHINDIEQYKLIHGILSVNGIKQNINYCLINESHNIDIVKTPTIIETYKVKCK